MKLTPYRKSMLIVAKLLEFAEIGGMEPTDCGAVYEAFAELFGRLCTDEGDESVMENLIGQVSQIIHAEKWT